MAKHLLKLETVRIGWEEAIQSDHEQGRDINSLFLVHYEDSVMKEAVSVNRIHGFFRGNAFDCSSGCDVIHMEPFNANDIWSVIRGGVPKEKDDEYAF